MWRGEAMTRATRAFIEAAWRAERIAGLLQWAVIAAALAAGTLAVLGGLGLALARIGGGGA